MSLAPRRLHYMIVLVLLRPGTFAVLLPFRAALSLAVLLLLPYGHRFLQLVDGEVNGFEARLAMWRADRDDHGCLLHRYRAQPMVDTDVDHVRPSTAYLLAQVVHGFQGHRLVRLVLQQHHSFPFKVVPRRAHE
uniref:Putative secreted peptide n=1 Tax=Anopheles braziliensis TaxID=58242 RepID=A0A2M3ZR23_9DIPT